MKKTLLLCAFLVGLVSSNVMALTLDEARTQGRVGETFYGYLVALKTDAETEKLVTDNLFANIIVYQRNHFLKLTFTARLNRFPLMKYRAQQTHHRL